ncbi:MAG: hypothetical protein Kapaf2KO_06390 [Candidatus Kapaibacteriales bacterium]
MHQFPRVAIRFAIISLTLIASLSYSVSQESRFTDWRNYSSMYDANIAELDGQQNIWVGTKGGLYIYNSQTEEYSYFRAPEDLSGNNITGLNYDSENNRMYVGYVSGAFDVFELSEGIRKLHSNNDIITANIPQARVEDFEFYQGIVYVSGLWGFGIYDPATNTFIEDTKKFGPWPVGTQPLDMQMIDNEIFVVSALGLVKAQADLTLVDPSKWSVVTSDTVSDPSFIAVEEINGVAFVSNGFDIYRVDGDTLITSSIQERIPHFGIAASGGELYLLDTFDIVSAFTGRRIFFPANLINSFSVAGERMLVNTPRQSLVLVNIDSGERTELEPLTPKSNFVKKIYFDEANSEVYYTTGAIGNAGVQRLTNEGWVVYDGQTVPDLPSAESEDVHRIGDTLHLSYFIQDLIKINLTNDTIITNRYNASNTNLSPIFGDVIAVPALEQDRNGRLWCVIAGEASSGTNLAYYDPDRQTWIGRSSTVTDERWYNKIEIDNNGGIWLGGYASNQEGLLYFNYNGTIEDTSDDIWEHFTRSSNPLLLSNVHNDLELDLEGNIWVATPQGLSVILNPASAARGSNLVLIEKEQLSNFPVSCLAVDAINNMWAGTEQGIYVFDPTGEEVIARITMANSPLSTNSIIDIEIDASTGTAYIGTPEGLFSVRTSFVRPEEQYEINVYPQPFSPDADGEMVIEGLAPDTDLKITTPNGLLIAEHTTTSGIFIWNGRDKLNKRIQPGVYFIIATSESTDNAQVRKFAVSYRQ